MISKLFFDQLRSANLLRCIQFRDGKGVLCHPNGVRDWSLQEWSNAMAGECGEACNITKKIGRGDYGSQPTIQAISDLADEIADVVIYADLLAARAGIDLGAAIVRKFNLTSDKVLSDIKL